MFGYHFFGALSAAAERAEEEDGDSASEKKAGGDLERRWVVGCGEDGGRERGRG